MEEAVGRERTARRGAWRAELKETFALAWPIAVTNLLQIAILLTNTAFAGHLGTNALAAVTIGSSLYFAVQPLTTGLGLAAGPMLAQARGAARRRNGPRRGWMKEMRQSARQAIWAVAVAVLATWLLLWNARSLLLALGQDPVIAELAADYVRTLMWGLPFLGAFVVLRGFLAAMGQPGLALIASFVSIVVNAAVGWVLVFGAFGMPRLGLAGAGVAGTCANLAMLVTLLELIRRNVRLRRFHLLGRLWRPDWARFREVLRIGLPIAGQMWVEIGLFAAAAFAIGWLGAVAVAAHAIAVQVAMLAFRVPMGIGQAATARVGMAAGAGDAEAADQAGWVAMALGLGLLAVMSVLIIAGMTILPKVFLSDADPMTPMVAASAATLLIIVAVFQLVEGMQAVIAGALRGLRDTRVPALLVGVAYWGFGMPVGLILAFPLGLRASGIWLGLTAGMTLASLLLLSRWRRLTIASPVAAVNSLTVT